MAAKSGSSKAGSNGTSTLDLAALEDHFARITRLMYDTRVPVPALEREVIPLLSAEIEFVDPWVRVRGRERFAEGLSGFHRLIRFDLDLFQVGVQLDHAGGRGRAIVDGVMNLRQLGFYTYPLRTIVVYDFALTGKEVMIDRVEEMWSFGDMIQHTPLVGRLYELYRAGSGRLILGLFRLASSMKSKRRRAAKTNPEMS